MTAEATASARGFRALIGPVVGGIVWTVVAASLTLSLALAVPRLIGGQSYAVLSNSMAGSIDTGDLVIVLPRRATEIAVGEIVAFKDPEGSGKVLQHRVQRISHKRGRVEVVTMGDANSGYERWHIAERSTVGRVETVIAKAGYLFGPITKPIVRGLIGAAAWIALLGLILLMIWRRPDVCAEGVRSR